jgi:hypothetical protein
VWRAFPSSQARRQVLRRKVPAARLSPIQHLVPDPGATVRRTVSRRWVGSRWAALVPGVWQGCYVGCESEVGQAESGFERAQEGIGGGGAVEAVVGLAVAEMMKRGMRVASFGARRPVSTKGCRPVARLPGRERELILITSRLHSCPRRTSRVDRAQVAVDDQDGQHAGWERLDWGLAGEQRNSGPSFPGGATILASAACLARADEHREGGVLTCGLLQTPGTKPPHARTGRQTSTSCRRAT